VRTGWSSKRLGDVSEIRYGYTESASFEPVGPRFLRITDIQEERVCWDRVPYCIIAPELLPKFRLETGDIVFARTGATTGKSFLVSDPPAAVFASYLIRLRVLSDIRPSYLSYYFRWGVYWAAIKEGSAGSAQGGFNASKLADLEIPFPSGTEQERIVAILDEAFEGVATAQANAHTNLQNAHSLLDDYLKAVFMHHGKKWVEKRLDEVAKFSSGGTPPKQNESYWSGKIPWVSGRDMKSTRLSDSLLHISKSAVDGSSTRMAPTGTLLILVRGMGLAHGAQIAELMAPCAFNQDIKGIHPEPGLIPRYLLFALRERVNSSGTAMSNAAHGTLKIDSAELVGLTIPVPPREYQQRVVTRIDSLTEETQRLGSVYQRKLAALDELKQSLLHQAFTGKL
jgi:type I restriction enzyme S subunit